MDLQQLKDAPTREAALRLDVALADGTPVGTLLLAGRWVLAEPPLLAQLARWRQRNMRMFLTWFQASGETTAAYLRDVVLAQRERALFFVLDAAGAIVGHMGVAGWAGDGAELDNFVRGEAGGHPQLMRECERRLLEFLFANGVRRVQARVLSYNWMAQDLHAGLGFAVVERLALRRTDADGGTRHDIVEAGQGNVPYHCVVMERRAGQPGTDG